VDATYIKCRDNGRVISMAFVIAVGVKSTGEREVLGFDLGPTHIPHPLGATGTN